MNSTGGKLSGPCTEKRKILKIILFFNGLVSAVILYFSILGRFDL